MCKVLQKSGGNYIFSKSQVMSGPHQGPNVPYLSFRVQPSFPPVRRLSGSKATYGGGFWVWFGEGGLTQWIRS